MVKTRIDQLERILFSNLDPFAEEIVMNSKGKTKVSMKTKLQMKNIRWIKEEKVLDEDDVDLEKLATPNEDSQMKPS